MSLYSVSVDVVLAALARLSLEGKCPTLLCLPDVMVWRRVPAALSIESERAERRRGRAPTLILDGHACISALTAAHLGLGLAGDFQVWLVAKVGPTGKRLLEDEKVSIQRLADGLFRYFHVQGSDDREITTRVDSANEVERVITEATDENQLSWSEIGHLGLLPWCKVFPYSLLVGDAESCLVRDSLRNLVHLARDATVTVVDTSSWGPGSEGDSRARDMWNAIAALWGPRTFISLSDRDAARLRHALSPVSKMRPSEIAAEFAGRARRGFLILHTSEMNLLYYCGERRDPIKVPACAVEPKSTNGAGDTFNGAFALAAMILGLAPGREPAFAPETLMHSLAFATAVVSLRLQNEFGHYPTRVDLTEKAQSLQPKCDGLSITAAPGATGGSTVARGQGNAAGLPRLVHALAPVWCDVPKLALIDLDNTLCDSKFWRETAAAAALRKLGFTSSDDELKQFFDAIYQDHDAWTPTIGGNVRYDWGLKGFFQLALVLKQSGIRTTKDYTSKRSQYFTQGTVDRRQLCAALDALPGNPTADRQINEAKSTFDNVPAFPYGDVVGALLQLRSILGFRLAIVTEGDRTAQRWKLKHLGLGEIVCPDDVFPSEAFASIQEVNLRFARATAGGLKPRARDTLEKTRQICERAHQQLKELFRAETLRDLVDQVRRSTGKRGVYVCTIGDRIETDVKPYIETRRKVIPEHCRFGLVIAHVARGYYRHREKPLRGDEHIRVSSLSELVNILAKPGFWHGKRPIEEIGRLKVPQVSSSDRVLLDRASALSSEVTGMIARLLELIDGKL
ncbi:MAG: HAD family hydrolase [Planctomycetota bacterium]